MRVLSMAIVLLLAGCKTQDLPHLESAALTIYWGMDDPGPSK